MAENSNIEWTTHTFNLVWGCQRVSEGCRNCYAEALAKRYGHAVWGPTAPRKTMADAYWKQPIRWNKAAASASERPRVFCSSMADVFEDHVTNNAERPRLWQMIRDTPHLDWLLLTKRPQNIAAMLPDDWRAGYANVWLGATAESQEAADARAGHLVSVPAAVKFLSCEPLLGPLNLTPWLGTNREDEIGDYQGITWIIAGGESGPDARPMNPDWVRDIRDQCEESEVAFLFKQWGEWAPDCNCDNTRECRTVARPAFGRRGAMFRCGKKRAGRILDGRKWDGFPRLQVLEAS